MQFLALFKHKYTKHGHTSVPLHLLFLLPKSWFCHIPVRFLPFIQSSPQNHLIEKVFLDYPVWEPSLASCPAFFFCLYSLMFSLSISHTGWRSEGARICLSSSPPPLQCPACSTQCYGLNVCSLPKCICWNPNLQGDIRKWGFVDMSGALMNGIRFLLL